MSDGLDTPFTGIMRQNGVMTTYTGGVHERALHRNDLAKSIFQVHGADKSGKQPQGLPPVMPKQLVVTWASYT
ncbi:hypothetical protein [Flexibacterium corallicola]|uniref:hypothetical protein n=1 Tax=Flexibacterium corallicola TaxID=3037259 RepID=UPI00286F2623|nr:hypothetical protein [Pseudovibrio sp. M1P-2-3]